MQMSVVVGCFEIVNTVDYLGIFWIFACSPKRPFSNIFSMFFRCFCDVFVSQTSKKNWIKKKKKKKNVDFYFGFLCRCRLLSDVLKIVNTVDYLGIFWIFACSHKRPFSNIFSMFFRCFCYVFVSQT
jgi:hypothetical protein